MYGELDEPGWIESTTAIGICVISFSIKSNYYRFIFLINGVSSCISHNPYVSKFHPKIQEYATRVDEFTIDYSMFTKLIFDHIKVSNINKLYLLILVFYGTRRSFFTRYRNTWIFLIALQLKYDFYILFISTIALLSKYYENRYKLHNIWHIFGTLMFKAII